MSAARVERSAGRPSAALRRVRVGSANPPKIQAVRDALAALAPGAEVEGVAVASGVAEQPLGFAEIVAGARSRARAAFASGALRASPSATRTGWSRSRAPPERWFNVGCAAVVGRGARRASASRRASRIRRRCAERAAAERAPIGELFDAFWRRSSRARAERAAPRPSPSATSASSPSARCRAPTTRATPCSAPSSPSSIPTSTAPAERPRERRRQRRSSARRPASGDLVAHLASGEKPRERWRVGTEHEKIGLYADDFRRVPFEGERGIGELLRRIAELDGWTEVREDGNLIALEKDGASITLEPGGQLELSGAPLVAIHETCREFSEHLELVRRGVGAARHRLALASAWTRCTGSPTRRACRRRATRIMRELPAEARRARA